MIIAACTQAQRLQDRNNICWTSCISNFYLSKKISLNVEYNWRRENYYQNWQQSLARGGVQYNFNNDVSVLLGYGYIITFPYGDYPPGRYYTPEHRIFEQLAWTESYKRVSINHRLRLEQRMIGKIDQKAADYKINGYNYLNRVRYQMRLNVPLNHTKMEPKTWYAAAFDELFIGFGSNVNQNIFDQNRLAVLGGYQFTKSVKLEAGFLSQIVQQSALVNSKQVYQYNSGLLVSLLYTHK